MGIENYALSARKKEGDINLFQLPAPFTHKAENFRMTFCFPSICHKMNATFLFCGGGGISNQDSYINETPRGVTPMYKRGKYKNHRALKLFYIILSTKSKRDILEPTSSS